MATSIIRASKQVKFTPLVNKPGNEMIRIGVGRNNYRLFGRVDLWNKGVRVTVK
ncbi:hypothetical protein MZD04_gp407 [Pseudomonas phage Psa21]|uniref:Uncharacterized protein n=1 Tax=Pseudomonas phage Psa21 TaxID=2530023 RepID=A0A481W522_9CAUD|nr:hypothetical protein MZD04_gp407 [Pseudomonas phage Psa21]QBJ02941.1 hypothetical protein PSA21_423 [Pseudomonas phage Psa21]